ncbi:MAG: putative PEP-binding protein [Chitinophagaceae bacterium]
MNSFIIPFREITLKDLPEVGGKNASLGERINKHQPMGINVPDGFAITVEGFGKKEGIKIGLCCQAPGDPEFSQFLVRQGIDSISFTQDALVKGIENIARAEKKLHLTTQSQTHENYHL